MSNKEGNIYEKNIDKKDFEQNTLANIIKFISWFVLFFGILFSLGNMETFFINALIYIGIFLGTFSLGEIIQILHDIRLELRKKNK